MIIRAVRGLSFKGNRMDRITAGKLCMLALEQQGLNGMLEQAKKLDVKPILPQIPVQLLMMLLRSDIDVQVSAAAYEK